MVYLYNGILLSHKKEWNNAICSNMDGPRDYHTKWSKPDKDKYHGIYDIPYMWNLKKKKKKKDRNEVISKTERDSHRHRKETKEERRVGEG